MVYIKMDTTSQHYSINRHENLTRQTLQCIETHIIKNNLLPLMFLSHLPSYTVSVMTCLKMALIQAETFSSIPTDILTAFQTVLFAGEFCRWLQYCTDI